MRYELTPDYTGAVHHLRPLGGAGGYTFCLARGTTALTVDAAGVVSLTTPLAVGLEVAEFSVADSAGTVVAFTAEFAGCGGDAGGLSGGFVFDCGRRRQFL